MRPEVLAEIIQEGGRLITGLLQLSINKPQPPHTFAVPANEVAVWQPKVTTDETITYQKREIAKELVLLEGHLQQGCKIGGKPCDCCEKHPIKIEGLAQEAAGMSSDPIFRDLAQWVRDIIPKTTEAAAASGEHDVEYPDLAIRARDFRKTLMQEVKHEEAAATEA